MVVYACNPRLGKENRQIPGIHWPTSEPGVRERMSQKGRGRATKGSKYTWGWPLASTHRYTHINVYLHRKLEVSRVKCWRKVLSVFWVGPHWLVLQKWTKTSSKHCLPWNRTKEFFIEQQCISWFPISRRNADVPVITCFVQSIALQIQVSIYQPMIIFEAGRNKDNSYFLAVLFLFCNIYKNNFIFKVFSRLFFCVVLAVLEIALRPCWPRSACLCLLNARISGVITTAQEGIPLFLKNFKHVCVCVVCTPSCDACACACRGQSSCIPMDTLK